MKTIGERIKNKRKELGMTQAELAQKLNVTDRAVSKWEVDQGKPDFEILTTLADVLGVSLDYLIKGVEPKKEEIVMSRMEYVCKKHDIEGLKELRIRDPKKLDETGHNLYDYIEKYNVSEFLNEISPGMSYDPFIRLAIKFDNLSALENIEVFEVNGSPTSSNYRYGAMYGKTSSELIGKEGYKAPKILKKFFSLHEKRYTCYLGNRIVRSSPDYANFDIDCITPYNIATKEAIKTNNKEAIAAILPYIIDFNKQEEKRNKRNYFYDSFNRYDLSGKFYKVYLNKEEITALLKLGLIDEAKYFNSIAKKEEKVEDNQIVKYGVVKSGNKEKLDTRIYDVTSGKIVIISRLEKTNDPKFIIETLKTYPICYEEYVLDLAKEKKFKELFEFYVDSGLNTNWLVDPNHFEDELDDFIKSLNRRNGTAYAKLYEINRLNDINLGPNSNYKFHKIMEESIGTRGTVGEHKGSILPFAKMIIYGEKTCRTVYGHKNIKEVKQEIIGKYEAKIKALKMVQDNYKKDYFLKELSNDNIESVVIKLCTLLEVKLKAMGKIGDLLEMLKSYCDKFYYTYDDGWNGETRIDDDDKHTVDILQRLRMMRNAYLHAEVKDYEPLSNDEIVECINYICDEMEAD